MFNNKDEKKGLISVIKYEGPNDVFVYKHPVEDFNLGSQLIVHESQEALFFNDGRALDLFGSGRHTLVNQNIPLISELYKLPTGGDAIFHSEVYFINMTTQMGIKWGTDSKVRLFDPASGLHIEIGACGNFNLRVNDSRKLVLKIVGTESGLAQGDMLGEGVSYSTGKFKALVMNKVKSTLARAIKEQNINILEIDAYLDVLSESLRGIINETLDEYGLVMPEFYITSVMTPDDDPNFKRLKQQFADKTLKVREEEVRRAEAEAAQGRKMVEAQTEAQLKTVSATGEAEALKIKAQAEAEAYRMQAEAEAREMQMKGYTYQQETARQVGLEAMQNGITGGGSGSSGGGLGDIAGLGVTLGAMGGVINMTKDALDPIMGGSSQVGAGFGNVVQGNVPQGTVAADKWVCLKCGQADITTDFCPNCGAAKTESIGVGWDCVCGRKGITSNFCPDCGAKKPEKPETWDCVCGAKNITSKFCPDCGAKKPDTWDCVCGAKNIASKFCPECGKKRGDE